MSNVHQKRLNRHASKTAISEPVHIQNRIAVVAAKHEKGDMTTWFGFRYADGAPSYDDDGEVIVRTAGDAIIATRYPCSDVVIALLDGRDSYIDCYGPEKNMTIPDAVNAGIVTAIDFLVIN